MARLGIVVAVLLAACAAERGSARLSERARADAAQSVPVRPGAERPIRGSGARRVPPGLHLVPARTPAQDGAALVVEGAKDLVLDLTGAELRGAPAWTDLDSLTGIGILLVDCERVTVRGGRLGGYKTCVAAFECRDLVIEDVAFEGWYGMRLLSTPHAENEADWLWPHENDAHEWIDRYGAAIALTDCSGARIERCRGRRGQNGILLTRSDACSITGNDFSFLSGWGLALYRSSRNRVSRNVLDHCVRGYSHDVYWRGQDSAGILVFEQSSDNLFQENSATHCGDGVFLYGGRAAAEGRSEEGSDRNVFVRNDFSFAVANAVEATFSRDNWIVQNRLDGSRQHGIWGGYSTRLAVLWNEIRGTRGGAISIEHGVDCAIVGNQIEDSDVGLELWWDEDPTFVERASSGHLVASNRFERNGKDLEITSTSDLAFGENVFAANGPPPALASVVGTETDGAGAEPRALLQAADGALPSGRLRDVSLRPYPVEEPAWLARARAHVAPPLAGAGWSFDAPRGESSGLASIVMGTWGPWDFRSGEPKPVAPPFGGALAGAAWDARWFAWDAACDPRADLARWRARAESPLVEERVRELADPWGGSQDARARTGTRTFGLVATTRVAAPAGRYELAVTSDDGVRALLDGKVVLENWTWHGPTRDTAQLVLDGGSHELAIEYFQIDGAWALAIELLPR